MLVMSAFGIMALSCICGFDFEARYGEFGKGFIQVHHIVPVSEIGERYVVDPKSDLVPVCPNCHAMIHRRHPPLSIGELREIISLPVNSTLP
jgi:5-methylcytosine-specific restriction protein A